MLDIIVPAVNGTKSILETAVKHGCVSITNSNEPIIQFSCSKSPSIKRIVVTASTVGVSLTRRPERQHTEEEWNEAALKEVRELGKEASGITKYSASKTLAEKGGSSR